MSFRKIAILQLYRIRTLAVTEAYAKHIYITINKL